MAQRNNPNMDRIFFGKKRTIHIPQISILHRPIRGNRQLEVIQKRDPNQGSTGENPRQQRAIQEGQRLLELEATNAELSKEKERLEIKNECLDFENERLKIENERLKTENEHLKTENERCVNELSERLKNQHLEDMEQQE